MYDVSIIGAGVVGSAIARELAKYNLDIALIEKESDVSTGASKANTGIVHGGYVAKAGTLKGELCIKGNAMYKKLDEELNFGYQKTGGLVLAFDDEDEKTLRKTYENAIKVGQSEAEIEIIDKDKIKEIEPHVSDQAQAAFYCSTIGVTSPFEFTIALAENAVDNGVDLKLESEVINIEKHSDYFEIETVKEKVKSRYVVNAAGIYADKVASMLDADDFEIYPMRGEYVVFSKSQGHLVNTVIFQAPNPKTKGVVTTTTTHGNFMIGPNAEEIDKKNDVSTTFKEIKYIIDQSRKSIPNFDTNRMLRTFAGLRPKSTRGDFIIEESSVKGFIQAAGIDSPGITSSPAIAKKVVKILNKSGLELNENKDFNPFRPGITVEKSENFAGEIDHQDPEKNIICRCETVTEAEILDALSRSIPIKTTDAVKRRTRAKTGECQANFCGRRIKNLLSRELDIAVEQIKDRDEDYVPERLDVFELKKKLNSK
ncbi:glycerol-3-phosphate dehydrogenase [Halanaerobium congolense]|jgi:glycerol-3-phosphate dehydrogenase|uniref:Glycerol-3-phosphate dehydrogenase n=1 Tax=Halanaerobium congolense TaxID=54121 RepID=A0A1G8I9X4_9FIRM|nr:NAD(P)/FAD-dependent oxidoreductase [Halanaerobium congolense]PUU90783.1 MAG: glycerol-3-phosphate dehydrogenase [Halanaerobium sp.]SDI15758.1 glycerol-3-phosphate dehydrogenase [Halanaerobium congolense]SES74431.1 glycerol-3-phosphate dehydrogenase [Halanaerobium congolense]